MALLENTLFGKVNKVEVAIDRLKTMEPEEGYWLATSCGKDSGAIERLAQMAGVKYEAHYSRTSVDPPELVRFAQNKAIKKEIIIDQPRYEDGRAMTMWNLIPYKKMPPRRNARYCCEKLKESSGKGRITVTGVRWAESTNRASNQGEITITDKKAIKMFNGNTDANFRLTNRGGWCLI